MSMSSMLSPECAALDADLEKTRLEHFPRLKGLFRSSQPDR